MLSETMMQMGARQRSTLQERIGKMISFLTEGSGLLAPPISTLSNKSVVCRSHLDWQL
jgi:hypothetical protein